MRRDSAIRWFADENKAEFFEHSIATATRELHWIEVYKTDIQNVLLAAQEFWRRQFNGYLVALQFPLDVANICAQYVRSFELLLPKSKTSDFFWRSPNGELLLSGAYGSAAERKVFQDYISRITSNPT